MILSSQYLVQTVWFQLREWRKNGLEVLKLNISKGPVSRPPLSGSDCLNLVLDFGTTLQVLVVRRAFLSAPTSSYISSSVRLDVPDIPFAELKVFTNVCSKSALKFALLHLTHVCYCSMSSRLKCNL